MRLTLAVKQVIKTSLLKSTTGKLLLRIGLPLYLVNWVYQRLLKINCLSPFLIHYTSRILHPQNIHIENDEKIQVLCSIATSNGCYIQAFNGIYLGEGTIFGPNITIVSSNHTYDNYSLPTTNPPIRIGKYCWLGASSVICPGVVLGDHTIVGAGSVVTKSFPDGHVVIGGVPASVIKRLPK